MMGWRVGYLAFPEDGSGALAAELVKVQVEWVPSQLPP